MKSLTCRDFSELCREYGISRKTVYKWRDRFVAGDPGGLEDLNRKPKAHAEGLQEETICEIARLKQAHPTWGTVKIREIYRRRHPAATPGESSSTRVLERAGLSDKRKRRPAREAGQLASGRKEDRGLQGLLVGGGPIESRTADGARRVQPHGFGPESIEKREDTRDQRVVWKAFSSGEFISRKETTPRSKFQVAISLAISCLRTIRRAPIPRGSPHRSRRHPPPPPFAAAWRHTDCRAAGSARRQRRGAGRV